MGARGSSLADMDAAEARDAWAQLAWQVELGADEAILDAPVDRFTLGAEASARPVAAPAPVRLYGTIHHAGDRWLGWSDAP